MTLDYHKCDISHLDVLADISRNTFIRAFEQYNNPVDFKNYVDAAFSKAQIKTELVNSNCLFYFVFHTEPKPREKQVLVAYFKLNKKEAQNEAFDLTAIELERLYVLESFQNKGLGAIIMQQVLQIARSEKAKSLWLGVWEENRPAIRFYEQLGFVKFGTHPFYLGKDRQTDWLMKTEV